MNIIKRDLKHGKIRLRAETLDDLWHIHHLVKEGDTVYALTYRKEETPADMLRAQKATKKRMVLGIEVEKVEFSDFSDRVRILGVIREGPQDVGSHHTLILQSGDDLTIVKKRWPNHDLDRLTEAVEATKRPLVTFLSIEDGNALIAKLHHYGVREIAVIDHTISGKQYKATKNEKLEFYKEVLDALKEYKKPEEPLIVLGPGFAKEEFMKFGREREKDLFSQTQVEATGQAGMTGITEALKGGTVSKATKECRVEEETLAVERLLSEIAKNGVYSYGPKEVLDALNAGAVELLMVLDRLVRENKADKYLELAQRTGAKSLVVSNAHEAGRKLDNLSGFGAILRYKLK
jgi:protein pelota